MKLHAKMLGLSTVVVLGLAAFVWAQEGTPPSGQGSAPSSSGGMQAGQSATKSAPAKEAKVKMPATKEFRGTVTSMTDTQLVLSRKAKDKTEEMTFVLDPTTQKRGTLKTGSQALVSYRVENSQNVATVVRAHSVPPAAASGKVKK